MRTKIIYQSNKNYIMKKLEMYLQSRKQSNKIETMKKIYEQQIEEVNKKFEDLTQASKMLKTPNS